MRSSLGKPLPQLTWTLVTQSPKTNQKHRSHSEYLKQGRFGDFSSSPMGRTPHFHCCGPGVQSLVRELRSHMPCGTTKLKKKNKQERFAQVMQELRDQKRKRQTRVTETNSPCDHYGLHGQRANMAFPKLRGHPAKVGPMAGGGVGRSWSHSGDTAAIRKAA